MSQMPKVIVTNGPYRGTTYELRHEIVDIGRSPANHITLSRDASISRNHARIMRKGDLLWVEDLGSKNGTFLAVGGGSERRLQPNQPAVLLEGAKIRLGLHSEMEVEDNLATQDEAVQHLLARLRSHLQGLYATLSQLTKEERLQQCARLRDLEARLQAAEDEAALLRIVADELPDAMEDEMATVVGALQPDEVLPPLPEDLPEPDADGRVPTLLNIFITDIRGCLDLEDDDDDDS